MQGNAAVIIAAAGSGSRMQADIPKQFLELAGKPLLIHTVEPFYRSEVIGPIVVAASPEHRALTRELLDLHFPDTSAITVVAGGSRRQDSVKCGLDSIADDCRVILVHDGARPLVSADLIRRCHEAIVEHGAAIAAVPVKDTLKREGDRGIIAATIDRTGLWQAQTPQGATRELLERAYRLNGEQTVTDEASLFENTSIAVRIVAGEEANIKVTRPEDLILAASILSSRKRSSPMRIGHGFDAHRFAAGRKLVLGGVDIEHHQGLAGHSDADVVCHALCDALLGAAGDGDIGRHFPDTDEKYRNISSLILLEAVVERCLDRQMKVANADITIICQAPKLASFIEEMESNLARHCRVDPAQINIKATTTEKMGYAGRQEGIGCHAVILLEQN
jgi:2-C-methyl-D-erythritol 4-phosphate cytidylyltransferase/2-C-methyl-D-erythritol 2,4-cyclodiphosphate synthase